MRGVELTYATRENINPTHKVACYYCLEEYLAEGIKQFTGGYGHSAICPKCGIDSVVHRDRFYTYAALRAKHVKSFHFASGFTQDGRLEPEVLITCGHEKCSKWDEYVREVER